MVLSFPLQSLKFLGILVPKWSLGLYIPSYWRKLLQVLQLATFIDIFNLSTL